MKFSELADIVRRTADQATAERVLAAICHEAQGENVYIPRRFERPDIRPEDTAQTLQKRYRVSRATAYNWVSAWRK